MLTDQFSRVKISDVIVEREKRQRRKIETGDLEASIRQIGRGQLNAGLIQPIIIERSMILRAGERRLTACRNLGHETIIARWADELNPIEQQVLELEENLKRSDLEWRDIIRSIGTIHELFKLQEPSWTATETAERLSLQQPTISMYLRIWAEFADPAVQAASGIREAYNRLKRRDARAAGDGLEELLGVADEVMPIESPPEAPSLVVEGADGEIPIVPIRPLIRPPVAEAEVILNTSFLEWAKTYSGPKFNLIHCDFPYGTDLFAGPQGRGNEPAGEAGAYDDSAETYWTLLTCFCEHLDNFMALSGHLMFWLSWKHAERTKEVFASKAPSLRFNTFPLIWHKTDNAGISSDPRFLPRHIYETCLVARRSDRQIRKVKSDVYACPIGPHKQGHVSVKPEPMLREFFEMFVDEGTSLLDPTCGSGASLRAADGMGARRVLGLEIDRDCAERARSAFRLARILRGAAVRELAGSV